VFVGAGAVAVIVRTRPFAKHPSAALGLALLPPSPLTGLAGAGSNATLWRIGWYFAEAAASLRPATRAADRGA
jgi:hypothetical protein